MSASDWKEAVDPRSGRKYYANVKTKQTTWKIPDELKRARETDDDDAPPPPPPPPSSGGSGSDAGSASEWKECKDASGRIYYANTRTGATSWKAPTAAKGSDVDGASIGNGGASRGSAISTNSGIPSSSSSGLPVTGVVGGGVGGNASAVGKASQAELDSLKQHLKTVNAQLDQRASELSEAQRRASQLEAELALAKKSSGEAARLQQEVSRLRAESEALRQTATNASTAQSELVQSKVRISSLEAELQACKAECKTWEQQCQKVQGEAAQLRIQLTEGKREVVELKGDLMRLQALHSASEQRTTSLEAELDQLRSAKGRSPPPQVESVAATTLSRGASFAGHKSNSGGASGSGAGAEKGPPSPGHSRSATVDVSEPPSDPWQELHDPTTGKTYYHNTKTGETSWEKPLSSSSSSTALGQVKRSSTLASIHEKSPWQELEDTTSGKKYYHNTETGVTTWDRPPELDSPPALLMPPSGVSRSPGASVAVSRTASLTSIEQGSNYRARASIAAREDAHDRLDRASIIPVYLDNSECLKPLTHDFLETCTFHKYADKYFREQKKGLMKKQTLDELVSHVSEPISAPLLKPNNAVKNFESDGTQVFRNISSYMGERKSSKGTAGHVEKLSRIGLTGDQYIRDEIFLQIVKQTNRNPSRDSNLQGWRLMCILLGVFTPSQELSQYLKVYFQKAREHRGDPEVPEFAKFAEEIMWRAMHAKVPRRSLPSPLEVEAVEKRLPIHINVTFLDRSRKTVAIQATTTVGEVVRAIIRQFHLPSRDDPDQRMWTLYEPIAREAGRVDHVEMDENHLILDVRDEWKQRTQSKDDMVILFKARLFFFQEMQDLDADVLDVYFVQALYDVVRSNYACTHKQAIELAALAIQAQFGDDADLSVVLGDNHMPRYLPRGLVNQYRTNPNEIRKLVEEERKKLIGTPTVQAKGAFLEAVQQYPTYGCTFFPVTQILQRSEEEAALGVSERGVFVCNNITRELQRKAIKISEVKTIAHNKELAQLTVVSEGGEEKKLTFRTTCAAELVKFISTYRKEYDRVTAGGEATID